MRRIALIVPNWSADLSMRLDDSQLCLMVVSGNVESSFLIAAGQGPPPATPGVGLQPARPSGIG